MSFDAELGPLNYVAITFGSAPIPTAGLDALTALVDQGRILLLDVEFVGMGEDGSVTRTSAAAVGAADFEGAASSLIDDDDVALLGERLSPGGVGLVVVYEDLTLLPALHAWAEEGAEVVAEGPLLVDELIESLDATPES